jgi:Pup amidohydrolase
MRHRLALASGETATALEVQRALLTIARDYAADAEDAAVIATWESVLEALARDPFSASKDVEWVAKLQLMGRMRNRYGSVDTEGVAVPVTWDDDRLKAADVQWSEVRVGLAWRLAAAGAVTRLTTDAEVDAAVSSPPTTTRAWLRGRMVATRPDIVDAAGWSSIVLDRETDHGHLEVVNLPNPMATTHALLDSLIDEARPGVTHPRRD